MHSCLENWYDSDRIVCTVEPALPPDIVDQAVEIVTAIVAAEPARGVLPPRTGRLLLTEQSLVDPPLELAGVPVEGYIDLTDLTEATRIRLYDFKTRSAFRRSGASRNLLTPAELAEDVQMCSYAAWAMRKYGVDSVEVSHIYIRTTGKPVAEIVTGIVTLRQAQTVLDGIARTVADMGTAAGMQLVDVEPNYDACNDYYRPCPYIAQCLAACGRYKPPAELSEELSTMSVFEKAAAHRAAGSSRPTASTTPPPTAGTTTGTVAGTVSATNTAGELSIYVDCLPTKGASGNVVRLEDEIAERTLEITAAVASGKLQVENMRADTAAQIVDLREVKYGTGTTALLANFKRRPPTGVLLATSAGLSGTVVDALLPSAAVVVRGLR